MSCYIIHCCNAFMAGVCKMTFYLRVYEGDLMIKNLHLGDHSFSIILNQLENCFLKHLASLLSENRLRTG